MPHDGVLYIVLFGTGLAASTLNVIAGGGSFLTLPILILAGLPATMANGTNRVGILVQNVAAVWSFRRHGLIERRWILAAALPATAGAVGGTAVALWIGDETFKRILAFLMIAVTLWTLWDPLKPRGGAGTEATVRAGASTLAAGYFLAGIYGGFVQAGVGFLLLAASTLAGLDLVRGNAMKVLCVLVFTPVSLGLFAWQGQVAWLPGLALASGSLLGGLLGVRLSVLKGHHWIRAVVTVAVIALAVRLWFSA